jgi:hypothetical protein
MSIEYTLEELRNYVYERVKSVKKYRNIAYFSSCDGRRFFIHTSIERSKCGENKKGNNKYKIFYLALTNSKKHLFSSKLIFCWGGN